MATCSKCRKADAVPGGRTCASCRARARADLARKVERRRAVGRCIECNGPLDADSSYRCELHLRRARERKAMRRSKMRASGTCIDCGARTDGAARCAVHTAAHNDATHKWRGAMKLRASQRRQRAREALIAEARSLAPVVERADPHTRQLWAEAVDSLQARQDAEQLEGELLRLLR